jgi:hypothetical protein
VQVAARVPATASSKGGTVTPSMHPHNNNNNNNNNNRKPPALTAEEKQAIVDRISLDNRSVFFDMSSCPITESAEKEMEQVHARQTCSTYFLALCRRPFTRTHAHKCATTHAHARADMQMLIK